MSNPRRGYVPGSPGYVQHNFAKAPQSNIQRSKFDRSHGHKTTFNAGYLVPVFVDEMLPGDTFNMHMTAFARLNTLKFPIMDNMYLDFQFFFVPNRLVWDNWEKFCGAREPNTNSSIDYLIPTVQSGISSSFASGSIYDYFGIPTLVNFTTVNSLPLRAYNLIWNEWFRSEDLQDMIDVPTGDGPDSPSDFQLMKRNKRADYFTRCLPAPQKGNAVSLPLAGYAPVISDQGVVVGGTGIPKFSTGLFGAAQREMTFTAGSQLNQWNANGAANISAHWARDPLSTGLVANLGATTAATINQIRFAFQTQRFLERDARGGTRYQELLLSHFKTHAGDSRLNRPEFLTSTSNPIQVTPVAQTVQPAVPSQTAGAAVLSAYATCAPHKTGFTYSAVEHGYVIGLASLRADLNYQQGVRKLWLRGDRYSFYWPVFAHLGEQAVSTDEIYYQGHTLGTTFGYQERWAEYRYFPSMVTGQFRSNHPQSYDVWHLAQDFANAPTLNSQFLEENPPIDRVVLSSTNAPHILLDMHFKLRCARPMPVYSVPGLIDHF